MVCANVAVVKVSGAWDLGRNGVVAGAGLVAANNCLLLVRLAPMAAPLAAAVAVGDITAVDGDPFGVVFGLRQSWLRLLLTASIGRKHCASGLNVFVTSRSAQVSSCRSLDSE